MHLFITILTDDEPVVDDTGRNFPTLEAAIAEAVQTARDLMADALRAGRFAPVHWRVEVTTPEHRTVFSTSFEDCAIDTSRRRHVRLI